MQKWAGFQTEPVYSVTLDKTHRIVGSKVTDKIVCRRFSKMSAIINSCTNTWLLLETSFKAGFISPIVLCCIIKAIARYQWFLSILRSLSYRMAVG